MKKIMLMCLLWILPIHAWWWSPTLGWWSSDSALAKNEHDFALDSLFTLSVCIEGNASVTEIDEKVAAICKKAKEYTEHEALIFKVMLHELTERIDDFGMRINNGKNYKPALGCLASGVALAYAVCKYRNYCLVKGAAVRKELRDAGMHYVNCWIGGCKASGFSYHGKYYIKDLLFKLYPYEGGPYLIGVYGGGIISFLLAVLGLQSLSLERHAEYYYEKYSLVHDRLKKGIESYMDENSKVADYPIEECV